ncbi:putative DNA modification/repair radical SAM protein [Anatilimnocola floriformis]|uniref:putative DNA modification/repair radical SAM protein n=1 Tax=Anatilimnocola floriformis TaxID=2948575 RepID=UPI0020C4149A|nr:putative DNA modification/repair radical SAM protein [Anatilimnocola floriformis]
MEVRDKLAILADAAKYDASCASSGAKQTRAGSKLGTTEGMGICHSYTPDGRCVSLLKILLTNFCIYDCQYCVNRVSSDTPRARFTVDEVVSLTIEFYKRNYIEGLFLSSGIIQNSDYTMEQLIAVAKTLRTQQAFGGYIHLKTIPNASPLLLTEAGRWADRLSVNIELPTAGDLLQLAPEKKREQITDAMQGIAETITETKSEEQAGLHPPRFAPAGQSTQMIVGATDSPDADILQTATELYDKHQLRRVYYSAYSPIPHADARLPGKSPPLVREHRLYQADWLMRYYGFDTQELIVSPDRNLSLELDPKLAWALANRQQFPIDVNRAPRELLLRVPGFGVRNVEKMLSVRRHHQLRTEDLRKLRVAWNRARAFVITADHNPALADLDKLDLARRTQPRQRQLLLFEAAESARSGEV